MVFRTDASAKIGFGHLKRSAYLASLLKNKTDITFCINKDKTALRFLEDRGASFCVTKERKRLDETAVKSIVFDLRDFSPEDVEWLKQAKEKGITTVQVTDLGLSRQPVDVIIDPSVDQLFPYADEKKVLLGPRYMPLFHKFRHFNKVKRKYRKQVKNVFVSLGGAAQYRQLQKLIDVLSRHRFNVKTAAGFYLKKSGRKALMQNYPRLKFVGDTESLARPLFEADTALITSGVAAAEAAAVGTPALYFHYHNEQKFIAESYQNRGAGLEISKIDELVEEDIVRVIRSLTLEKRIQMGAAGKQLVDGGGAARIVDFFEKNGII